MNTLTDATNSSLRRPAHVRSKTWHSPCKSNSPESVPHSLEVIPRIRPLFTAEEDCSVISHRENKIFLKNNREAMEFSFDCVLGQFSSQEDVFKKLSYLGEEVLAGFAATVFAYGQTGSGKTFTMFGDQQNEGLVFRFGKQLVNRAVEFKLTFVELYREKLSDLLSDESFLSVKENPAKKVNLQGAKEVTVCSEEELVFYLNEGIARRQVSTTEYNAKSSRSHAIIRMEVLSENKVGCLTFVDLAGSEKASKVSSKSLEDTKNINLSLSALGKVINSLSQNLEHVPYRDSKLTRILKDSLGGNTKTVFIVTCCAGSKQKHETLTSLRFAQRAKGIKVKLKSEFPKPELTQTYEFLKSELNKAKSELNFFKSSKCPESLSESTIYIKSPYKDTFQLKQEKIDSLKRTKEYQQSQVLENSERIKQLKLQLKEIQEKETKVDKQKAVASIRVQHSEQINKQSKLNLETKAAEILELHKKIKQADSKLQKLMHLRHNSEQATIKQISTTMNLEAALSELNRSQTKVNNSESLQHNKNKQKVLKSLYFQADLKRNLRMLKFKLLDLTYKNKVKEDIIDKQESQLVHMKETIVESVNSSKSYENSESWKGLFDCVQSSFEIQLEDKQKEIQSLNELMSEFINKYSKETPSVKRFTIDI